MTTRYNPPIDPFNPKFNAQGGVNYEVDLPAHQQGRYVHYSDYEKLVEALRMICKDGWLSDREIAEAALLSVGEEL
jgi:hypothetical protein